MLIKRWVKYVLALIFHYSGLNRRKIITSNQHYILMFHRIENERDLLNISIPVEYLKGIIQWTKELGQLVGMTDMIEAEQDAVRFCITFDDGFESVKKLNELEKEIPYILYLATGYIETSRKFWAIELERIIMSSQVDEINLSSFQLSSYNLSSVGNKELAISKLNSEVKKYHPADIEAIIKYLRHKLITEPEIITNNSFLSWSDIRDLINNGMEVGGHTHRHVISTMVTPVEFKREVCKSNQLILDNTGLKSKHFAYPNGRQEDISVFSRQILKDEGYASAVTTMEGSNNIHTDLFLLKRYNVSKDRIANPWGNASKALFTTMLANPIKLH